MTINKKVAIPKISSTIDALNLEKNCVAQVRIDLPIRSEFQDLFNPEKCVIN